MTCSFLAWAVIVEVYLDNLQTPQYLVFQWRSPNVGHRSRNIVFTGALPDL